MSTFETAQEERMEIEYAPEQFLELARRGEIKGNLSVVGPSGTPKPIGIFSRVEGENGAERIISYLNGQKLGARANLLQKVIYTPEPQN